MLISDRIKGTWKYDILRSALDDEKTSAKPLAFLPMNENHTEGMIRSRKVSVDQLPVVESQTL